MAENIKTQLENGVELLLKAKEDIEARLKLLEEKENRYRELEEKMKNNAAKASTKIILDVGGKKFATAKSTLLQFKDSYFYAMLSSGHWQPDGDGSFFIDRNPKFFGMILDYMRTGEIDVEDLNKKEMEKLKKDLDYFQISLPTDLSVPPPPTSVEFDENTKSSGLILSGDSVTTRYSWAIILGKAASNLIYWEILVDSHGGAGHIRVGIARNEFNGACVGCDKNSLCIYPGCAIQGYETCTPPHTEWNKGDCIGMLFDREASLIRFYHNKRFIHEVKNIPNAKSWSPAFNVHCTQDKFTLLRNVSYPSDYPGNK